MVIVFSVFESLYFHIILTLGSRTFLGASSDVHTCPCMLAGRSCVIVNLMNVCMDDKKTVKVIPGTIVIN